MSERRKSEYIYIRYCLFEAIAVAYVNMGNLALAKDTVIVKSHGAPRFKPNVSIRNWAIHCERKLRISPVTAASC